MDNFHFWMLQGVPLVSGLQRDGLIQAEYVKVQVSTFCLNSSLCLVDALSVPFSILQPITVLVKCLRFPNTSLQRDTVAKDCSSGCSSGHIPPQRIAFTVLETNVEGLSCRSLWSPSAQCWSALSV